MKTNPPNDEPVQIRLLAYFVPNRDKVPPSVKFLNKVLGRSGFPFVLIPRCDHRLHMMSIEQASNIHHLVDRILATDVPGEFVELGCYGGSSAALISGLIEQQGAHRELHVYDRFDIEFGKQQNIREVFRNTIHAAGVPMPIIHEGDFLQTVPMQLPEVIAFAHVDCGTGGSAEEHAQLITHCLEGLYPRLAQGAVLLLMDYHRAGSTLDGYSELPGVQVACDAFFLDKPEHIQLLYGGPYSHAFVRKR